MATDNRTKGAEAEKAVEAYCHRVLADAPAPSAERLDDLASLIQPEVRRFYADRDRERVATRARRPRRRPTSAAAIVATTRR